MKLHVIKKIMTGPPACGPPSVPPALGMTVCLFSCLQIFLDLSFAGTSLSQLEPRYPNAGHEASQQEEKTCQTLIDKTATLMRSGEFT